MCGLPVPQAFLSRVQREGQTFLAAFHRFAYQPLFASVPGQHEEQQAAGQQHESQVLELFVAIQQVVFDTHRDQQMVTTNDPRQGNAQIEQGEPQRAMGKIHGE